MEKIYIYLLKDPHTQQIKYVGKTKNTKQRLRQHINNAKIGKCNRHIYNWINSLSKKKIKPILIVLEECNLHNWQEREKYWIKYYKGLNYKLCNHSNGGEGTKNSPHLKYRGEKMNNSVLKESQVLEIRKYLEFGFSNGAVARHFKIKNHLVDEIKVGNTWKYLGKINTPKEITRKSPEVVELLLRLKKEGKSYREIKNIINISMTSIIRIIKLFKDSNYDKSINS